MFDGPVKYRQADHSAVFSRQKAKQIYRFSLPALPVPVIEAKDILLEAISVFPDRMDAVNSLIPALFLIDICLVLFQNISSDLCLNPFVLAFFIRS